jgi:hypothetical protein
MEPVKLRQLELQRAFGEQGILVHFGKFGAGARTQ